MTRFIVERATRPLTGTATVPGDKSISHRSAIFAGLGDGTSEITGLSTGEDVARTRRAMSALGATFTATGPTSWSVEGTGVDKLTAAADTIDCGNSGTSIRLLCGLLAGQRFESRLTGDHSLRARPMGRVATPLARMGAVVTGEPGAGEAEIYPPLVVRGGDIVGIDYQSPIASAQVKSCVLLAGLHADGETRVTEPRQSRDHTERMLAGLDVPVTIDGLGVTLHTPRWDRRLPAAHHHVPGDPSAAAFLLVAALVTGASALVVKNICVNRTRTGFLDALSAMGAAFDIATLPPSSGEPIADLRIDGTSALGGSRITDELTVRSIDEIPILAIAAAVADGVTEIRDAAELRVKESDRIATTTAMLRGLGVTVHEHDDGLTIEGSAGAPLAGGCTVNAAGDHRIAMAAAIGGLVARDRVVIEDVVNVATSFPGFLETMNALGASIRSE